jgi:hypothetical protein
MAGASSPARAHNPPVVRPRFRYVVGDTADLWAGPRYALAWVHLAGSSTSATLIDDQTGRRTTIARPGCHPLGPSGPLNLPWIIFICSPATNNPPDWELYSTASGRWLSVSPSPGVLCGGDCRSSISAAGRYWLQFQQVTCPSENYHSPCNSVNVFQNIQTGQVRHDPSNGSTMVDLNAPNLKHTVCPPLSGPGPGPPLLRFSGNFALSAVSVHDFGEKVYLERCGTSLHRLLWYRPPSQNGFAPSIDAHEVVWMAHPGPFLTGLTLAGLRRFTIRLPEHLLGASCTSPDDFADCIGGVALTNRRLYLVTASYPPQVWAAPVPLPAKRHHAYAPLTSNRRSRQPLVRSRGGLDRPRGDG